MVLLVSIMATATNRFHVEAIRLQGIWTWDTFTETCGICRNNLTNYCIACQSHFNIQKPEDSKDGPKCVGVMGTCGHSFHFHCIDKWIKTRKVCPLDNKPWKYLEKKPKVTVKDKSETTGTTVATTATPSTANALEPTNNAPDIVTENTGHNVIINHGDIFGIDGPPLEEEVTDSDGDISEDAEDI